MPNIHPECSRAPTVSSVSRLDLDGVDHPSDIWSRFPCVKHLRCGTNVPPRKNIVSQGPVLEAWLEKFCHLLATVPDSVLGITIGLSGYKARYVWPAQQSNLIASSLLSAVCASSVRTLTVLHWITPCAADLLLRGLTNLNEFDIRVHLKGAGLGLGQQEAAARGATDHSAAGSWKLLGAGGQAAQHGKAPAAPAAPARQLWRPAAPSSPTLESVQLHTGACITLDLTDFCSTGTLRCLHASAGDYTRLAAALSQCKGRLASLDLGLQDCCPPQLPAAQMDPDVCFLQGLEHLSELRMRDVQCSAAGWRVLASLPKLCSAELQSLALPAAEEAQQRALLPSAGMGKQAGSAAAAGLPVSTSLQRLELQQDSVQLPRDGRQLPGCMARLLPNLSHLRAECDSAQQLLSALQVHSSLSSLSLTLHDAAQDQLIRHDLLSQLPCLQQLMLDGVATDVDSLLTHVALCPRLRELYLSYAFLESYSRQADEVAGHGWEGRIVPLRMGLPALAAGPCSQTLESICADNGWVFSPAEVAALLHDGLPNMRHLSLDVEVPRCWTTARQVQHMLPGLLRIWGAALDVEVACDGHLGEAATMWYASCSLRVLR